ncbi:MAG: hypothetical protein HC933_16220 [Pleurocapsa sp. SU_196_0]|nr:hypothetical protein [Pleurocapsa sp. SU_196_0]
MAFAASHNPFAWIATHAYAYPLLEALHIVGIALLLGSLVMFELRVALFVAGFASLEALRESATQGA